MTKGELETLATVPQTTVGSIRPRLVVNIGLSLPVSGV